MNDERMIFEGKDLEEAVQIAAARLNVPEGELHYEILEQGRRGVFGLGARAVRIRALDLAEWSERDLSRPDTAPARHVPRPAETEAAETDGEQRAGEPVVDPASAEQVRATAQQIVDLLTFELRAEVASTDRGVALRLTGADERLLHQKDGELLQAFQFLLNRMARRSWPDVTRITLGGESGSREDRDRELVEGVREAAREVVRSGRPRRLRPMNAYERRLVHLTVREFRGLTSRSEGDGSLKRVRISRGRGRGAERGVSPSAEI